MTAARAVAGPELDPDAPLDGAEVHDLSDAEAQHVAWAFGIYAWIDREDLNRQLRELMP